MQDIRHIKERLSGAAASGDTPGADALADGGTALSILGIRKRFGETEVVRAIDLEIPSGQFVAVVGRSGSGKSTLLRLIAGLETPDAGTIAFDRIGGGEGEGGYLRMMFQEPRLLPWARVLANVEVGIREADKAHSKALASDVLREVGLESKQFEWPSALSGGQRQRVALARALVSRPRILLLDEPLGALDALTRLSMQSLLARVWAKLGFTAILVTHDVQEAVSLADRVLVIDDGSIVKDVRVGVARPRTRDSAELAKIQSSILEELLTEDN
ncbi:ATP-binding cassette domain-containing protein [Sphingomonas sp. H39-1-10]|uniref:ABC transporter ATP-binding protein n=1 Tax=Sphingomonadales TaxID=204457 RepID=UPI000C205B71|nr:MULTISPECIES: ATP-binding cassette domain-containing protein [Sphingomonadaceae]MDF0490111.1 ATP-binding cassette domain-containing protein [Sphingomonas pollutisoli]PJG45468.1 aliphatic sulfonate ABC transporter ATP-binding protein [Sphingobium sp. LB126]